MTNEPNSLPSRPVSGSGRAPPGAGPRPYSSINVNRRRWWGPAGERGFWNVPERSTVARSGWIRRSGRNSNLGVDSDRIATILLLNPLFGPPLSLSLSPFYALFSMLCLPPISLSPVFFWVRFGLYTCPRKRSSYLLIVPLINNLKPSFPILPLWIILELRNHHSKEQQRFPCSYTASPLSYPLYR